MARSQIRPTTSQFPLEETEFDSSTDFPHAGEPSKQSPVERLHMPFPVHVLTGQRRRGRSCPHTEEGDGEGSQSAPHLQP